MHETFTQNHEEQEGGRKRKLKKLVRIDELVFDQELVQLGSEILAIWAMKLEKWLAQAEAIGLKPNKITKGGLLK